MLVGLMGVGGCKARTKPRTLKFDEAQEFRWGEAAAGSIIGHGAQSASAQVTLGEEVNRVAVRDPPCYFALAATPWAAFSMTAATAFACET